MRIGKYFMRPEVDGCQFITQIVAVMVQQRPGRCGFPTAGWAYQHERSAPEFEHAGVHEVEIAPAFLQFNRHILFEQEKKLSRIRRPERGLAGADDKKEPIPLRLLLTADDVP
jgi:hypothetical protein